MEFNDIYDKDRNLTGRVHRRGSRWKAGEYGLVVCVWVYDGKGNILLTRRAKGKSFAGTWENSGGAAQAGENSIRAIVRELEEETGFRSENIEWLVSINSWPAFTNEVVEIFVARDLIPSKQKFDEEESIELEEYTIEELKGKVFAGEIKDSKTVAGILAYAVKYGN